MIRVLKAGFYTSIQDKGRTGFASFGVPISGVMDSYSADKANHILNNSLDTAVLEITFGGCILEFLTDTFICISGGDFSPKVNNRLVPLNSRIKINKNDRLSFGKINYGSRCYVSVKDGFLTQKVLNSRSFYKSITTQSVLKKDDIVEVETFQHNFATPNSTIKIVMSYFNSQFMECYKGPEFDLLNDQQKQQLITQIFSISKDNNRMGYRLNELIKNEIPSIFTSAVLPGTVQLTPSGKLIVLMRDCQVTGGYPRVLQLSEKSICMLAQKSTNQRIRFQF